MNQNKKNFGYDNALASYMKEAGKTPLLSREEETHLAGLVRRWLDSPRAGKIMKKKGEEARDLLIKANLRLVIKIAKEYRNLGLDFADLIAEGNLGLMQGVDKFLPDKGAKLSYYVSFWIKQSIRRGISNKGRTIRLPVAVIDSKIKLLKFIDKFKVEHVRGPTEEEIEEATGIKIPKIKTLLELSFQSRSLNEKVYTNDGDERELSEIVENNNSTNPYQFFIKEDDKRMLNVFLDQLDVRQRYIIRHRFGLGNIDAQTLEAIGKKFNLTRERIRQLEGIALVKLKEMCKKIDWTNYGN